VMSKGQYGPKYSLYGVISHAGGGPNSGHYYAHVKAGNGSWYEMNDESVDRVHQAPINMKNAYILFYVQLPGQALAVTIKSNGVDTSVARPNGVHIQASANGVSKKRKASVSDDEGEDTGEKTSKPFIGPVLPSSSQKQESTAKPPSNGYSPSSVDPNAEALKRKIDAHTQKAAQRSPQTPRPLVDYADDEDDEDEDTGETVKRAPSRSPSPKASEDQPSQNQSRMDVDSSPKDPPPSSPPASSPIATLSFYGKAESASVKKTNGANVRAKTKIFEAYARSTESRPATPIQRPSAQNPYTASRVGNSIDISSRARKTEKNVYGRKRKLLF